MQSFEYKVVPAPNRGKKAKGTKTPEARFALGVETVLNEMAAAGWEYVRADMLPSEERSGLTGSKTNWRNLLVFRRAVVNEVPAMQAPAVETSNPNLAAAAPVVAPASPTQSAQSTLAVPISPPTPEEPVLTATAGDPMAPPEAKPVPGLGARQMISDDGVEEVSPVLGITAALKARARKGNSD